MTDFDFWMLLAGIGLFLFGIYNLESGLRFLAGAKFKQILQSYTDTSVESITVGTLLTALLQSSSLVTIIMIAFVGAGVMGLYNAIGVLIGANIGTTFTSLLISWIGFGSFKISLIAFPIITIGGAIIVSAKQKSGRSRAKVCMGLGLLFLGLDFMNSSVEILQASIDISSYTHFSLPVFFLFGIILTVVLQSSTAVGMLTLTALNSSLLTFPESVAIIIGANLGTTFTAVLASLGGATIKKQLALAHIIFNLILSIIGTIFFWQYIRLVQVGFRITDPIAANAVLNFIFNFTTALLFAPFLGKFTDFIQKILPQKDITEELTPSETNNTEIVAKEDSAPIP